jgi:hypothetical protein
MVAVRFSVWLVSWRLCPIHQQFELSADAGIGLAGVRPSHRLRSILHRPIRRQQKRFADAGTMLRLISDCHS